MRAALFILLAGCGASASSASVEPPVTPTAGSPASSARPLVIASEDGLRIVGRDGGLGPTIASEPVIFARWEDDRTLLALGADGRRVVRVGLDGAVAPLATLPERVALCASTEHVAGEMVVGESLGPEGSLHVEEDADVWLSASHLCLELRDRNVNMMDYAVRVAVERATGVVALAIGYPDACASPPPPGCADDTRPVRAASPVSSASHAFDLGEGGVIVGPATRPSFEAALDVHAELRSPSGRLVVVSGAVESGDYVWRSIWILDRTTGDVVPVSEGRWVATDAPDPAGTLGIAGESTLEWLPGEPEVLVVDQAVLVPGVGLVPLGGRLAR